MSTTAENGPGQRQEPRTQCWAAMSLAGTQVLEPWSAASQGVYYNDARIRSGAATRNQALQWGIQEFQVVFNPLGQTSASQRVLKPDYYVTRNSLAKYLIYRLDVV